MNSRRTTTALLVLLFAARANAQAPLSGDALFEAKIRPLLAEHCWKCHGPKKQRGDVRLDARSHLLKESELGKIVVPGRPEQSVLWKVVQHQGDLKMPPRGKLPASELASLYQWIKLGAPWPEAAKTTSPTAKATEHWAFQPVRRPTVPPIADATPIDAFLLAKLREKNLAFAAPADRRTLLRRLSFALIGLPPTPEEVAAFEADTSPNAVERVVDRLLASPHYGERWARHWLDVARYADTKGYVFFEEPTFPWAYTYRDYVIRAFNEDKPYDRFVFEQLAADKLELKDRGPLTALGFLTVGGRFMSNVHDILDDRIDVITRGLLALTVTCARCHDHKYDPVRQKDYYGLYGILASSAEPTVPPLFAEPPPTSIHFKFELELARLEKHLTDFVKAKHKELVDGSRRRVAEYLLAANVYKDLPNTDDFMLIADTNDLNPTMIARWVKYLHKRSRQHDPIFAPWFAAAEQKTFETPLDRGPINRLVLEELQRAQPKSLAEMAKAYANVLHAAESPTPHADAAAEELRQVLYGPESPPSVANLPYGDLSLLPDRASQAKLQKLRGELEKWRADGPGAPPRAMSLEDLPTPFESYVFVRGNPSNRGEPAPRAVPALWCNDSRPIANGSGRLELARSIVDAKNPLTARVIVNRVWAWHFGTGLVRTPSDFGVRSDPPSHPELLDYLADEFVRQGWSLKKLHRSIVLSAAYRQRSEHRPDAAAVDPENRLLWMFPRQRLDFEATRDSLLAIAGRLDKTVGGPSVTNNLTAAGRRRTLYTHLDRLNVPGLLRTFDFPTPDATSPERTGTTIAPQALFLMNHPLVDASAREVVQRPDVAKLTESRARIERIHRLLFARPPSADECALAESYLAAEDNRESAWQRYVHALMQTNEFVTID
jgi:hypothetical protein